MMQSTFTLFTAAAVVLATLFSTSSMALADAPPTGLPTPSLAFITEEPGLKSAVVRAPPLSVLQHAL